MEIAVIGLGYVGSVSAACLAEIGHRVCGVDIDRGKVDRLNGGHSSIIEARLDELIETHVAAGNLRATTDMSEALAGADVAMIAVGTPSLPNGEPDLRPLRSVCADIHRALEQRTAAGPLLVAIRSTVPPGTIRGLVTRQVARDRYLPGRDFHVCSNPEFLREGTAVDDFMHQPLTVVGADRTEAFAAMAEVYAPLNVDISETAIEAAELVKYASNAYHAIKVCFGNEIGTLAAQLGVDGRRVMDIFCRDQVLNISSMYLKPGFSYGGSCLPKDVKAINRLARDLETGVPLLASITSSNQAHLLRGLKAIEGFGKRRIAFFGLAFKPGTADLRDSPMLILLERLQARKYQVLAHDEQVAEALEKGFYDPVLANRLHGVIAGLSEVVAHAEVAVVGKAVPEYDGLEHRLAPEAMLYDLAGHYSQAPAGRPYNGICWDHPQPRTADAFPPPGLGGDHAETKRLPATALAAKLARATAASAGHS